ncbi:TetR family transcriptional regulator [bacterium]|nr:TetR family transcriptional regulator [candidate division CSSED10-310 bacterium]
MTRQESDTAEKILDAALVEFSRKGKNGATVNDIAARAGANKAMIYYYFHNKDGLYEAVFVHIIGQIVPTVLNAFTAAAGIEDLVQRLVNAYVDYIADHRDNIRLVLRELAAGGPTLVQVLRGQLQTMGFDVPVLLTNVIQSYMASGDIRRMDPRQLVISFVGLCVFYFAGQPIIKAILQTPEEDDEFLEERKASIVDLFLNGIRGAGIHPSMHREEDKEVR